MGRFRRIYLLIEPIKIPIEEPWNNCDDTDYLNCVLEYKNMYEWLDYIGARYAKVLVFRKIQKSIMIIHTITERNCSHLV